MLDDTGHILFLKHLEVRKATNIKMMKPSPLCLYQPISVKMHERITGKKNRGLLAEKKDIVDTYNTIKDQIHGK
ncbi:MAG TPA: hypothetical protein DDW86_08315 [Clostridiales bacterium]|jgi:hypothetical protein|nr:hypothetical protein [Clostridiales bacterium]